jgi:hypothetical protein
MNRHERRASEAWDRAQWRRRREPIHLIADDPDERPFWLAIAGWIGRHSSLCWTLAGVGAGLVAGRML